MARGQGIVGSCIDLGHELEGRSEILVGTPSWPPKLLIQGAEAKMKEGSSMGFQIVDSRFFHQHLNSFGSTGPLPPRAGL